MGLLGGLFLADRYNEPDQTEMLYQYYKDRYISDYFNDVKSIVDDERKRYEDLLKKEQEEAISYQKRQSNFGGAGRKGLIYGS